MGPRIDCRVGRIREADPEMLKDALRKPKGLEVSALLKYFDYGHLTIILGAGEEEHRAGHHWRQGRPYPRGQAGHCKHAVAQDERSQAPPGRRRRRGNGARGRQRGWRGRGQEVTSVKACLVEYNLLAWRLWVSYQVWASILCGLAAAGGAVLYQALGSRQCAVRKQNSTILTRRFRSRINWVTFPTAGTYIDAFSLMSGLKFCFLSAAIS